MHKHNNDNDIKSKYGCNIVVAVAGNPNVGKSTLFNVLTGEIAHVANWPGVTVERKEGVREFEGRKLCFVDLPGTYGITSASIEEIIAREYIISGEPDVILVLVDSTAPERTLYLPIQILELTPKVVIALTKTDLMHSSGIHVHIDKLESKLGGVPVIPVSAIKGVGLKELLRTLIEVAEGRKGRKEPLKINYGALEPFISEIEEIIKDSKALKNYPIRWAAIRLLEGDERLEEILEKHKELDKLKKIRELKEAIKRSIGKDPQELIITARFNFVDSISREVIVRVKKTSYMHTFEKILQHSILGPITSLFLILIAFLTAFVINTGFPLNIVFSLMGLDGIAEIIESYSLSSIFEEIFTYLSDFVNTILSGIAPEWITSLICDGVIPGVGAVISFLPLIIMIMFFLALLEDSGIAPRLAVSFNNFFSKFGLSGRALYPLVIGLGCNVPAVMSSRTAIEDEERVQIIFSSPFIPCQARLVVILAFTSAFFKSVIERALVIVSLYIMGILVYLITSLIIRRLLFKIKEAPELIIELPPIHKPNAKVVWWITWDYTKHFLRKAGLIIFTLSIITWFMLNYGPSGQVNDITESYAFIIGKAISPILKPFNMPTETSWKIGFTLFQGFIAKEAVVESIVLLEGGERINVADALRALNINSIQAFTLLLFITLYVPCIATLAVMYAEFRNTKLTILSIVYIIAIAYVISLITYAILTALQMIIGG